MVSSDLRSDVTYIGLAYLLPMALRSLCSCAGLFFARVLCEGEEGAEMEVAALPHYFDAPDITYNRHVRTTPLPVVQFACLLEWDRHLAGMQTSDVRDVLKDHVRQVLRSQKSSTLEKVSAHLPNLAKEEHQQVDAHPLGDASRNASKLKSGLRRAAPDHDAVIDVDEVDFEHQCDSVIVPLEIVRGMVPAGSSHRYLLGTGVNSILLRATLRQLRREQQEERNKKKRRALRNKERRIQRIFRLRGQVPTHKLIAVTPIKCGLHGEIVAWRVDIDVPSLRAAA